MKIKWYEFLIWTGIGALAAFILTLIFNVTGLTRVSSFEEASQGLFYVSDSIWVLIALYCFATPLIEELIFRYCIYNLVLKYTKKAAIAIILTAALFGIYHLNPVQMLYGFLMGLLITYSYHRYKILTIPFLVHAAANAVALAYTFL
ncbi:CPBP family intramembrane glutamic endopeptidase [Butyrivibrio sp. AE2032]|uniref:CPBP family intramembrane glutamic endopeptidase n=1 Tax=Butyrivibrio sp. AE2032 TaxID=1458463 RepID=UPI0005536276|nr:CPBP family intramembrane glutamic endopeptidase [Butyrivibrio sp. AE2032]